MNDEGSSVLRITLDNVDSRRRCGDCQLCCKLLSVAEIDKPANTRCRHQRVHVGCTIYKTALPRSCAWWSCRWLTNDDTADLRRPDRAHYVIDPLPDHVTARDNSTGGERVIPCVQVWCDPSYRDAHRDPALRAFIERRAREGWATLVRFGFRDAVVIAAPPLTHDGTWQEQWSMEADKPHTLLDTIAAITGGEP